MAHVHPHNDEEDEIAEYYPRVFELLTRHIVEVGLYFQSFDCRLEHCLIVVGDVAQPFAVGGEHPCFGSPCQHLCHGRHSTQFVQLGVDFRHLLGRYLVFVHFQLFLVGLDKFFGRDTILHGGLL